MGTISSITEIHVCHKNQDFSDWSTPGKQRRFLRPLSEGSVLAVPRPVLYLGDLGAPPKPGCTNEAAVGASSLTDDRHVSIVSSHGAD